MGEQVVWPPSYLRQMSEYEAKIISNTISDIGKTLHKLHDLQLLTGFSH